MKKMLIFLSVLVAAAVILIIVLCNNLFGIRDWIAEEFGWDLNRENTDESSDSTCEVNH